MMSRQPLRRNPWAQVPNPAPRKRGKDEVPGTVARAMPGLLGTLDRKH